MRKAKIDAALTIHGESGLGKNVYLPEPK